MSTIDLQQANKQCVFIFTGIQSFAFFELFSFKRSNNELKIAKHVKNYVNFPKNLQHTLKVSFAMFFFNNVFFF